MDASDNLFLVHDVQTWMASGGRNRVSVSAANAFTCFTGPAMICVSHEPSSWLTWVYVPEDGVTLGRGGTVVSIWYHRVGPGDVERSGQPFALFGSFHDRHALTAFGSSIFSAQHQYAAQAHFERYSEFDPRVEHLLDGRRLSDNDRLLPDNLIRDVHLRRLRRATVTDVRSDWDNAAFQAGVTGYSSSLGYLKMHADARNLRPDEDSYVQAQRMADERIAVERASKTLAKARDRISVLWRALLITRGTEILMASETLDTLLE